MADLKVDNKPRADGDTINISKSTLARHTVSLTAAALTLTSNEKALAAREYAQPDMSEPAKTLIVVDAPKIAFYQVQSGDSISRIAQRFHVPQKDINAANPGLDPDHISVGESLKLPNVTKGFHIISAGENPSKIAKIYGIGVKELMNANPGIDANHLNIGQALAMPAHSVPAASQPAPAGAPAPSQTAHSPAPAPATHEYAGSNETVHTSTNSPARLYASLMKLFAFEGGITRNKNDTAHKHGVPVTNMGVTGVAMKDFIQKTEHRDASNAELTKRIENLTTEEAIKVYAGGFWRKEFQPLGPKLSFLMFDWGVTSSPVTVAKEFQKKLGVPATGKIDAATIDAVKSHGEAGSCDLFTKCRKDFYTHLANKRLADEIKKLKEEGKPIPDKKPDFLGGWIDRADAARNYADSPRFQKMLDVFQHTSPRGCDLFDPVREGAVTLRNGSQEPALTHVLQERLSRAGWTVKVDGKFGPEMERVVANFKEHFNLPGRADWGKQETQVLDAILSQHSNG